MIKGKDSDALVSSEIEALSKEILGQFSRLPVQEQDRIVFEIKAKLIDQYLKAVKEVKANRKLSKDEKLRKLLTPLALFGNPLRRRDGTYPFISESIQMPRELDLEYLKPDPSRYRVEIGRNILNPDKPSIFCKCKFQENISRRRRLEAEGKQLLPQTLSSESLGYVSLREIHRDWLPSLNQKKIISTDLLDQLLVAYTIKRALNGDDNAIQKLYDLYINAAEGIAVKVLKSLAKRFSYRVQKNDTEDIKQDARIWLNVLIGGFKPEDIVRYLLEGQGKAIKPPLWIKSCFIYYLSEHLPQWIEKNLNEAQINEGLTAKLKNLTSMEEEARMEVEELISCFEKRNAALGIELLTSFNLFSLIGSDTFWRGTPKRINRFNSYSFRPGTVKMGPRRNLTTWLFGRKQEIALGATSLPPNGKLYQLLRDKWRPLVKEKSESRNFDLGDDFDEDHKEPITSEDRKKTLGIEDLGAEQNKLIDGISAEEKVKRLRNGLIHLGAPARDVEIYFRWKRDYRATQSKIAKEQGLSLRQVGRICQQIKRLLPKAKHLFLEE